MSATVIASAIKALADANNGQITPEMVVNAARAKDSPLHSYFEWDVKKAAHQHWLDQARMLIRSVKVEVTTTHFTVHAPAYVRDPSVGEKQGYASLTRLRTDEDMAREAVVSEFARASAALARAKVVAAALGMSDEIEQVRERVVDLTERVRQNDVMAAA